MQRVDRMHLMWGGIWMHLNATHVECNALQMHNNTYECTVFGMRKDAASTTASKCITMRHATYASRGECINMKRTFWMHENALECNMSRMQQVWKCIRMQPSRIGRMQQLKVVAKCVRMQPICRMQRVWMHAKNNEMHMNAHACIRMHMNAYGKKQHHFR